MHLSGVTRVEAPPRRRSTRSSASTNRIEDQDGQRQLGRAINSGKPYRGLSDELILKIYYQVYAAGHSDGTLPGLREILVSKRLYKVARPAWLRVLRVGQTECLTDKVIAGLIFDEKACAAIHSLDIKVFKTLEKTTAALLARLPNLEVLKLSFDHTHWIPGSFLYPLSVFFLRRLAQLPPLRQLDLSDPVCFKADDSLSGPRIRRVTTTVRSITPTFSAFLQRSGVKKLVILGDHRPVFELGELPWTSLQHLMVRFGKRSNELFTAELIALLGTQLAKRPSPLSLSCVTLDVQNGYDDFDGITHSMLSIFAPRGATVFRFRTAGTAEFDVSDLVFDKVRDVKIISSTPYNLTTDCNFSRLVEFVQHLPDLRKLTLAGLAVHADNRAFELAGIDETQLIMRYPMLSALLSFVTRMSVTTLVIVPEDTPTTLTTKRYKWTRQYRHEQLRLE